MAYFRSGQLAALMLNPDFGGITIAGREVAREDLVEFARFDAEQARHKREVDRLDKQLREVSDGRRKLTLSNLRRIASSKHSAASARVMAECVRLGIPIHLGPSESGKAAQLEDKLEALFERKH